SRHATCGVIVAVSLLFAASSAHAQWAAKPPPPLPRSILDQAATGSVVLGLVFESNGQVKNAHIVRSSGIRELDEVALRGAMRWRLAASAVRPSDTTVGRQHLVKFFQDQRVARRLEPFQAFWKEI
ncbi:MAG TPA: TonB family protein, partial [Chthoniobacterales bacterium]|nr:TonB family protein [Chthoniobacterales bacterium]